MVAPIIRRNADVIAAGIAEETILLNPTTWTYMHLNETAARIWEALDGPRSVEKVVAELVRDYEVEKSECERDVADFVRTMSESGFIVVDAPGAST